MRYVREGVDYVIPQDIYSLFSWKMIEERVTGTKTIDIEKLKSITDYNVSFFHFIQFLKDCKETDSFILHFWKVLESFNEVERSKYLKFVWGRARLPPNTESRHEIDAIQYRKGAMPKSHTW